MKRKGQFFTTHKDLQNKINIFIKNNPKLILEPSVGEGHLVEFVLEEKIKENKKNNKINIPVFDSYEIDTQLDFKINKNSIVLKDFLKEKITEKKYQTIIGNPPYVKTKTGNLYLDFIDKCVSLLDKNGELIFIVPSDFFKLTSSKNCIKKMLQNGQFTDIYHPHKENLFIGSNIDVIIFRYQRNSKDLNSNIKSTTSNSSKTTSVTEQLKKTNEIQKNDIMIVKYNGKNKYLIENNGIITFSNSKPKPSKNQKTLGSMFHIYVGQITGKEVVFKNSTLGNIKMLNDKNDLKDYIFLDKFPTKNKKLNEYMLKNKDLLINRHIRKFNENNWFEWGATRNMTSVNKYKGKECLFVRNLTRKEDVCFKDNVQYFGGKLICMIPKNDKINLDKIMKYLNSKKFKENYQYSGRFKIGHRQLCNALY